MKVIFLDIDGVLAPNFCQTLPIHPEYSYPFDPACVNVLNEIITATSAEIVLTSDWRLHFNKDLIKLLGLFKYNRVLKGPIDITPDFNKNRNKEIASYLFKYSLNIREFLILDDMDLKIHNLRFIKTFPDFGLSEAGMINRAIQILNSDQCHLHTCVNCESEYFAKNDGICCSPYCREQINSLNKPINGKKMSDNEIKEFFMFSRVQFF